MNKKIVGLTGCGAIGSTLAEYAEKELTGNIERIVLWDTDAGKLTALSGKLSAATVAQSMDGLIEEADLVIEAAVGKIVPELLGKVINKGKDIIIMSIGGILGSEDLLEKAREKGVKVALPSGAVAGIDAIKASKISGIESVTLTTRKAPRSIKGAPYLEEKGIDVDALTGETVIFEGNAIEAVKAFPKNVNVSALLSLAGIGADKTKVRIVVSPEYTKNIHEIEVISNAGRVHMRAENVPSPENPKTSYLAVLAAIASLRGYFDNVRIGT